MPHLQSVRQLVVAAFAAVAILSCAGTLAAADKRPNILFIFSDDHAAHAISAYGSKINQTPNLDRIANEGMLFENCFCTNSICGPSRAVILTGKHSHLNGFRQNGNRFDASQQIFSRLLQQAGYNTAMIGKWHLGHGGNSDPQGFDYWEVLQGQGPYYNPPMIRNGKATKYTGYTTDIITDLALDWLKNDRDKDKPFMLMYQHKAPHRNWQPGPKYLTMFDDVEIPEPVNLFDDYEGRGSAAKQQDMTVEHTLTAADLKLTAPGNLTPEQRAVWDAAYEPKNEAFRKANLTGKDLIRWKYQRYIKDYLRCVQSVDDNIGRVLDYLDEAGLAENTVVIYSSDQGFYLGDHGWFDKRFMYEESYRMPLLVRWPGVIRPGSRNRDLTSNLDFAETFLDIAGVEIPRDMQGASLKPLLSGQTPADWRQSLYYQYYEFYGNQRAAHMVRRHYGVRTPQYKLIHFYNLDEWELYDLGKDPHEMRSVYSDPAYSSVVKELTDEVHRLQEVYQVPDDQGSVPKDPPSLHPNFKPQRRQPAKKKAAKK
ncbi:sulfatase-like hydrolase/transferase [bacterium]|nr:sulfatase-like hydrolase/transferase [bacterium]